MAWNDTNDGFYLNLSYDYLRDAYNRVVPGHIEALRDAAYRPIWG